MLCLRASVASESRGARWIMVFAIRQLQEKCVEQHQDLHLVFIDLTKAFDTVNRAALWAILSKLGCPPRFVQIIRSFHDGMFCKVIENGDASDPFPVSSGVKQGCVLAPTLFSLLFAQMLSAALSQTEAGVKIHYRTGGDFFNLRRLKSQTKVTRAIVRDSSLQMTAHLRLTPRQTYKSWLTVSPLPQCHSG